MGNCTFSFDHVELRAVSIWPSSSRNPWGSSLQVTFYLVEKGYDHGKLHGSLLVAFKLEGEHPWPDQVPGETREGQVCR